MGESACEAGICGHCSDTTIEGLCDDRLLLRARVAALESALRKLRPYFGPLVPEPKPKDSVVGAGSSPFDAARGAFAVLDQAGGEDQER